MGLWSWVIHQSDVKNKFFTDGKQMLITPGIQAISNTKTFIYVDWDEVQVEGKTLGYEVIVTFKTYVGNCNLNDYASVRFFFFLTIWNPWKRKEDKLVGTKE